MKKEQEMPIFLIPFIIIYKEIALYQTDERDTLKLWTQSTLCSGTKKNKNKKQVKLSPYKTTSGLKFFQQTPTKWKKLITHVSIWIKYT